ncbi:hypothetical protein OQA88_5851 [Cercophora sp. LCS_1]
MPSNSTRLSARLSIPSPPAPPPNWTPHRTVITELYWTQDKDLEVVMETMRREHGFEATQRQYKRQLKAWGLAKNISAQDMRAMLCIRARRRHLEGKDTHFTRHGMEVPPDRLNRFARRKKINDKSLIDQQLPIPPGVRCSTPVRTLPADYPDNTALVAKLDTQSSTSSKTPGRLPSPTQGSDWAYSAPSSPTLWQGPMTALLSPPAPPLEDHFGATPASPFQGAGVTHFDPFFPSSFEHILQNNFQQSPLRPGSWDRGSPTQVLYTGQSPEDLPLGNPVGPPYYGHGLEGESSAPLVPGYAIMGSTSVDPGLDMPLHAAVLDGNIDEVRRLLDSNKAGPNDAALGGVTPLHYAAFRRNVRLVTLLKSRGACLDSMTETYRSILFFAVCSQDRLLSGGGRLPHLTPGWQIAHPDEHTDEQTMDVINALYGYDSLERPLQLLASLNQADTAGVTPLMAAAEKGFTKTVKLFLKYRAPLDTKDNLCYTALKYAANKAHRGLVELLLREDPRVKTREVKYMVKLAERNLRLTPPNDDEWWDITCNYDVDIIGEAMVRVYREKGVLDEVIEKAEEKRLVTVVEVLKRR